MPASVPGTVPAIPESSGVAALLRYRWLIFAVLGLDGMLLFFQYVWGATLSEHHTITWGLDAGQLGLLAALGNVPYALMQIPVGLMASRCGGRRLITLAMIATAGGTALFALAPTFGIALWARLAIGLASAAILLPTLTVLARWFRLREFATIQGAYLLVAAVGSLVGTAPLAGAAERWTWRPPMLAAAVATLLGAGLTWWLVRDTPAELGMPSIASIDPDVSTDPADDVPITVREAFRRWRTTPTFWVTAVIMFASWGALQSFQGLWVGPMLRHVRGFSAAEVGLAVSMFTLGIGFGPLIFGWLSDRVFRVRRPIAIAALIAQTLLWAVVAFTTEWLPAPLIYLAFLGIASLSGGVVLAQVLVKEQTTPHEFSMIFGIINGAPFYGTALIQLLIGGMLTAIGPVAITDEPIYGARAYTVALLPVIVLLIIVTGFAFRLRETPRRESGHLPQA